MVKVIWELSYKVVVCKIAVLQGEEKREEGLLVSNARGQSLHVEIKKNSQFQYLSNAVAVDIVPATAG